MSHTNREVYRSAQVPTDFTNSRRLGVDTARYPEAMISVIESESETDFGRFKGLWRGAFPTSQYVPETAGNYHFMIYPHEQGRHITSPADLSVEEMAPATEVILNGLSRDPNMVATYNIGDGVERSAWLPHGQSWGYLHTHIVSQPWSELPQMPMPRQSMRELNEKMLEGASRDYFEYNRESFQYLRYGRAVYDTEIEQTKFSPNAALVLAFDTNITPIGLAGVIKELHAGYEEVHEKFFGLFTTNYQEAKSARWTPAEGSNLFTMRSPEEFSEMVQKLDQPHSAKQLLLSSYQYMCLGLNANQKLLEQYNGSSGEAQKVLGKRIDRRKIHRAPCYSTSIFEDNGEVKVVFAPHLSRTRGALEDLNIDVCRVPGENVSMWSRKANAHAAFNSYARVVMPNDRLY